MRDISHKDNIIAPALNKDQLQIICGSYLVIDKYRYYKKKSL